MIRLWPALFLLIAFAALAQAPVETDQPTEMPAAETAEPCIPASETEGSEGRQKEVPPGSVLCEEQDPVAETDADSLTDEALDSLEQTAGAVTPASDPADLDPGVLDEEEIVEATADEVFRPGDEILEDYPVPLPSDI